MYFASGSLAGRSTASITGTSVLVSSSMPRKGPSRQSSKVASKLWPAAHAVAVRACARVHPGPAVAALMSVTRALRGPYVPFMLRSAVRDLFLRLNTTWHAASERMMAASVPAIILGRRPVPGVSVMSTMQWKNFFSTSGGMPSPSGCTAAMAVDHMATPSVSTSSESSSMVTPSGMGTSPWMRSTASCSWEMIASKISSATPQNECAMRPDLLEA
mmetsp:Transcript_3629/g.12634  ORF Transcript_3629/g.12634 Transcript_3629/m.12634 type:complete len:216 (-) Transcript_3629:617-1264(-)